MKIEELLANTSNYTNGRVQPIKYIVIHYTANNGDTARNNCIYFQGTGRNASAHYFVDENEVYRSVKDSDTAWHCGTSGTYYHADCRNSNAIGIELCSRKDSKGKYYFKDEVIKKAAELTKELMERYSIPIENLIRHYDVTHKVCPAPFVNDISQWVDFKVRLEDKKEIKDFDSAIKKLVDIGVINTFEFWYNAAKCINYIDRLIINSANKCKNTKSHSKLDLNKAIELMVKADVITTTDYWYNAVKCVKYLEQLIINIAEYI